MLDESVFYFLLVISHSINIIPADCLSAFAARASAGPVRIVGDSSAVTSHEGQVLISSNRKQRFTQRICLL